jgi:hypothetical protein
MRIRQRAVGVRERSDDAALGGSSAFGTLDHSLDINFPRLRMPEEALDLPELRPGSESAALQGLIGMNRRGSRARGLGIEGKSEARGCAG